MTESEQARRLANQAAIRALEAVGGPPAVQELAQQLGVRAIDGVFGLIERSIEWKRVDPCAAAEFHRVMLAELPRVRWLARLHHRRMWRRWRARCRAVGHEHACR